MSSVHYFWVICTFSHYYLIASLVGPYGNLVGAEKDFDQNIYPESENKSPDEFVNQAIHDYFVSFLPRCPSAYQISIEHANRSQQNSLLRPGEYNLCQIRGKARLRECSSFAKSNCGIVGAADYWLSIRPSSFEDSDGASQNNELIPEKEPWEIIQADCRPQECSRNQLMAINMKNPMDCSSFYICIMGHHFLLNCPVGHQFSEEYGVCIENKYTVCKLSSACL